MITNQNLEVYQEVRESGRLSKKSLYFRTEEVKDSTFLDFIFEKGCLCINMMHTAFSFIKQFSRVQQREYMFFSEESASKVPDFPIPVKGDTRTS
jgi:hypothetical protein